MARVIVYAKATNDLSGNPRRGWIIPGAGVDRADIFVDEGFSGRQALYDYFDIGWRDYDRKWDFERETTEVTLEITAKQYKKLK